MINAYDLVKKYTETTFKNENNEKIEDPCIIEVEDEKVIRIEGSRQSGKSTTLYNFEKLIENEYENFNITNIDSEGNHTTFVDGIYEESVFIITADIAYNPNLYSKYNDINDFIDKMKQEYDLIVYTKEREHKGLQTIIKLFENRKTHKDLEKPVDACAIEIVDNKYFRVYGPKDSGQLEVADKLIDIEKELSPGIDFDKLTITNNNYKKIFKRIKSNIQNNIKTIVVEDNFKTELTKDESSIIEEAREKATLYIKLENTTAFKTIETIKVWNDNLLDGIKKSFETNEFNPSYFKYSDSSFNNKVIIGWDNVVFCNFDKQSQWFKDGRLLVNLANYKTDFSSVFSNDINQDYIYSNIVVDDNHNISFISIEDRSEIDKININEIKSIAMCIENKFDWEIFVKGFARYIAETKYITFITKDDKPVMDMNYSMHCYLNKIIKHLLGSINVSYIITTHHGLCKEFKFSLDDSFYHQCFEQLNEFRNLLYLLYSKSGEFPFFKISADYVMSSAYLVANYLQNNKEFNELVNKNIKE